MASRASIIKIKKKMKKLQRKQIHAQDMIEKIKEKLHYWEEHLEELDDDYNELKQRGLSETRK